MNPDGEKALARAGKRRCKGCLKGKPVGHFEGNRMWCRPCQASKRMIKKRKRAIAIRDSAPTGICPDCGCRCEGRCS